MNNILEWIWLQLLLFWHHHGNRALMTIAGLLIIGIIAALNHVQSTVENYTVEDSRGCSEAGNQPVFDSAGNFKCVHKVKGMI